MEAAMIEAPGDSPVYANRRVYFVMPKAPFGAMAEQTLVDPANSIPLPDGLDDVTAAAIANHGMS